jgi:hypothetical protein
MTPNKLLKNKFFTGCSKRSRDKAPETRDPSRRDGPKHHPRCEEIQRNEAYIKYAAVTKDEGNAVYEPFSATC